MMNRWLKQTTRRRVRHGEMYSRRAAAARCVQSLQGTDVTTEGVRLFWRAQGMWYRQFGRKAHVA